MRQMFSGGGGMVCFRLAVAVEFSGRGFESWKCGFPRFQ